jgi:hypothetical protein
MEIRMKKSAKVTLTMVAAMGLAACNRRQDPCESAMFSEQACLDAVNRGGYYWHGSWVPMMYHYPYPFYYDRYRTYVSRGGMVRSAPGSAYTRSGGTSSSPGVERGGFGSTGSGHGAGE